MRLADLGIESTAGGLLLIAPTDAVLAEASRMTPRPAIASSLNVAEPAAVIAWWPERQLLDPPHLSRLRWMVQGARGTAWLIWDPGEEGLAADEVRAAATAAGFAITGDHLAPTGEVALELTPNGP